ncbi:MAG: PVC-type heme-binding CxxCH protein [Bryobacteraceae bacterium]
MKLVWSILPVCLMLSCSRDSGPPYSADRSLRLMQVESGFQVEKFVTEPDVVSPVAIEFDEDFRLWVVEDPGYPLNVEGKVGRVKLIADGKVTVFADNLVMPTGIMRWKKGVLVTDAPDLLYLEDTDGDGRADVRKPVLTGFAFTNPQHTVNSPVYGLDNWIYIAHENPTTAIVFKDKFGDRGSDIRFADHPKTAIKERGRNIRFRPETLQIEVLSGTSQFGQAFDDFGHHFTLNNTYHGRHEVIAARYLRRNPDLAVATAVEDISADGRPAKVFPIAPRQRFEMLTNIGQFTSACGLTFWQGSAFVAEPAHNLVFRGLLKPAGATFSLQRARPEIEFLASKDPWFRPVNFYAGPDGALYMLDYYRLVIEHPEWMSNQQSQPKDLNAGNDRGRIYRITHKDRPASFPEKSLGGASTEELVSHLANENAWWRRTAQRLLMDRRPDDAAGHLVRLVETSTVAVARVYALWTLEGFGRLEPGLIEKCLRDPSPGVRENAIRLAESHLPQLTPALLSLAADPDSRVRFQLLCTLGSVDTAPSRAVREKLLQRDLEDRWVQIAALSASSNEAPRLFASASRFTAAPEFFRLLGAVIGARRRPVEVESVLRRVSQPGESSWRAAALQGLAAGLKTPVASSRAPALALRLFSDDDPSIRRNALRVLEVLGLPPNSAASVGQAAAMARDTRATPELRADAVGLLALAGAARWRPLFERLSDAQEPEAVQLAAVAALGRLPGEEPGKFLIAHWRAMTSAVRLQAADAIYKDPNRMPLVLAALKNGDVQPWTLAFRHKRQLVMHRDPAIRDAARALLESPGGREPVIQRYQSALDQPGDMARGKAVFENVCSKCHQLNGLGAEVGPNLATVRNQPRQVLLADILDPNRSISQGFEAYVVETVSGATLDGVLGPQTATNLTLRREEGKQDVIARKDIKSIYVTNLSAMPADLEKQIDSRQMADLLEYIKNGQ